MNLSSLSGMQAGSLLLTAAADNTANLSTPDYHAERVDLVATASGGVAAGVSRAPEAGVDLAEQVVGQITGTVLYSANARAIRAQRETDRSLFDILA